MAVELANVGGARGIYDVTSATCRGVDQQEQQLPPPYPTVSPNATNSVSIGAGETLKLTYTITVYDRATARATCRMDVADNGDVTGALRLSFFVDYFPGSPPPPPPPPVPSHGLQLRLLLPGLEPATLDANDFWLLGSMLAEDLAQVAAVSVDHVRLVDATRGSVVLYVSVLFDTLLGREQLAAIAQTAP